MDFQTLELKDSPNQYLVCPAGFCPKATPDREAATYNIPAVALKEAWAAMADRQPRTKLTAAEEPNLQYDYVQRSLIFRFPDTITVRSLPVDDQRATLAVYSRSTYGYSDLGVNKKRIESWLSEMESNLP